MKKRSNHIFLVLLALAVVLTGYLVVSLTFPNWGTGLEQAQIGEGEIVFERSLPPPPPPSGGGGGGGRRYIPPPEEEIPCPSAAKFTTDGHQAGMLFAFYSPDLMPEAEIVLTVLDNLENDRFRALFFDSSGALIENTELGKENPAKVFTFNPADYVSTPSLIVFQSIRRHDLVLNDVVNNPIVGKMFVGTKGVERDLSMNLLGIVSEKPWLSVIEPANQLTFSNEDWAYLPDKAYNTHLFTPVYEFSSIFEPPGEIFTRLGLQSIPIQAGYVGVAKLANIDTPAFSFTDEFNVAIKQYNAGGLSPLSYGTGSFSSKDAGPERALLGIVPTIEYPTDNVGRPDSTPSTVFTTVGSIKQYPNGLVEDWLVITNINKDPLRAHVKFYDGKTCNSVGREIHIAGLESKVIRVSEMTRILVESEGVFVVESSKHELIVEKYGVIVDGNGVAYKLNAMAPFRKSELTSMSNLLLNAPRKFTTTIPSAKANEDFTIKLINLPALQNPLRAKQELSLHLSDGEDNWRSFEFEKSGCVININRDDFGAWAWQDTWESKPEHLAIFGSMNRSPFYASDVVTTVQSSPFVIANDPGHMLGEDVGNCCAASDCLYRWNMFGSRCVSDDYIGQDVCTTKKEWYDQADVAKPEPAVQLPIIPPPEKTVTVKIPYTDWYFPWWYIILGCIMLLAGSYAMYRDQLNNSHRKRKHRKLR